MNIKTKYFFLAIILAGSAGIWLPILVEALVDHKVTFHNIPQNITTYFVSLAFAGCIDLFLSKIRNINVDGIANHFLNIAFLIVLSFGLVLSAIILNIKNQDFWALILGLIGVLISYRIWWISNIDNPNFSSSDAILGGNPGNTLSNGK